MAGSPIISLRLASAVTGVLEYHEFWYLTKPEEGTGSLYASDKWELRPSVIPVTSFVVDGKGRRWDTFQLTAM